MGFEFIQWPATLPAWLFAIVVASLYVCAFIEGARIVASTTVYVALSIPMYAVMLFGFGLSAWVDHRRGGAVWVGKFKREQRRNRESAVKFWNRQKPRLIRFFTFLVVVGIIVWLFGS